MSGPTPSVSVVIPVYNPGPWIEPCIGSILAQSLPRSAFEAIFVDDGSTDGTAERLDRLAAAEPGVRVMHGPPSGAPGRPRNIGIAAARGDYIQFLDADDELAPEALERLLAMARRNRSDIVVGRFVSETLVRPQDLFERSIEVCTVADTPELLGGSLGPTKLFSSRFLLEHRIVFPEAWPRMEDQAFTLMAYLRARRISVLGGAPCYRFNRRADSANLSLQPIDPTGQVERVERLMDLVESEAPAGSLRLRAQRRIVTNEVLAHVEAPGQRPLPDPDREALAAALADLVRRRVTDELAAGLAPLQQVVLDVLRASTPRHIADLATRLDAVAFDHSVIRGNWSNGRLGLVITAGLIDAATQESVASPCAGPVARISGNFARDLGGSSAPSSAVRARLAVVIRHESLIEHVVGARLSGARGGGALEPDDNRCRLLGLATIDVSGALRQPDGLASGRWEILARLDWLGFRRVAPCVVAGTHGHGPDPIVPGPAIVGPTGRVVIASVDDAGFAIDLDRTETTLAFALAGRPMTLIGDGTRLALGLDIATTPDRWSKPAEIILRSRDGEHVLPATLRPWRGSARLETMVQPGQVHAALGAYVVVARLDGPAGPELPLGSAIVGEDGRWAVRGPTRSTVLEQRRQALAWAARSRGAAFADYGRRLVMGASRPVEHVTRRIVAVSPRVVQVRAESAYRRLRRR